MPYGAAVIMGKSVEISNSMGKPGANAVEKTCVIACDMKSFEKQLVVCLYCLMQVPVMIHLVEAQMQVLSGLHVMYKGKDTIIWLI